MTLVTLNGSPRELPEGSTVEAAVREAGAGADARGVAVAVDGEVVPRGQWTAVALREGQQVEVLRAVQGGSGEGLEIGGRTFASRLVIGTGGFRSLEAMAAAVRASGADLATVAMRRVDPGARGSIVDVLEEAGCEVLPNTAGCYTARDAVTTAHLAREAFGADWVKLEVIGDDRTLLPDPAELADAAEQLVADGFVVLPYTNDDPILARRLREAGGAAARAPGCPMGGGRGRGRRRRGGHAARFADRQRDGDQQRLQPAPPRRAGERAGDPRRWRR